MTDILAKIKQAAVEGNEPSLKAIDLDRIVIEAGAEHHLSHHWEMEFIRLGKRQLLHGANGVACTEISALYHRIAEAGLPGELLDPSKESELPEDQKAKLALICANWAEICQ